VVGSGVVGGVVVGGDVVVRCSPQSSQHASKINTSTVILDKRYHIQLEILLLTHELLYNTLGIPSAAMKT